MLLQFLLLCFNLICFMYFSQINISDAPSFLIVVETVHFGKTSQKFQLASRKCSNLGTPYDSFDLFTAFIRDH